ncbi:MAG: alpha/beta hydrolase [Halodesulfurarchaeum sp.]
MSGPHHGQPIRTGGADLDTAEAAVVLLHGRGATARGILQLGQEVGAEDIAFLAPQAAQNTWYPDSFLAPLDANEPHLSSALETVDRAVEKANSEGIPRARIALLGFSQGACLASEFVARNATRYGGLIAFSGGLIGPEGTSREYEGSLEGMPAFIGCSDDDPHIPVERVHETADVLEALDADVTTRIYEGMGHQVNRDELAQARTVIRGLTR